MTILRQHQLLSSHPVQILNSILKEKMFDEIRSNDFIVDVPIDFFNGGIAVYIKHIPSGLEARCGAACDRNHDKRFVFSCIQNKMRNLALFLKYYR